MKAPTARSKQTDADERTPIRHRWTAQPPGDSDEARAGTLLRSAAAVQPFGAKNLAEVAARLRSRERHLSRKWAWQIAIAVGLLLFGGAVSAAVMHFLRVASVGPALPDTPVSMPASKPVRRRHMLFAQPPAAAVLPAPEAPPARAAPRKSQNRCRQRCRWCRPQPHWPIHLRWHRNRDCWQGRFTSSGRNAIPGRRWPCWTSIAPALVPRARLSLRRR